MAGGCSSRAEHECDTVASFFVEHAQTWQASRPDRVGFGELLVIDMHEGNSNRNAPKGCEILQQCL